MKKFSMDVLKEYNEDYGYNFSGIILKNIYKELIFQTKYINHNDVLDEFDWFKENVISD